LFQVVPDLKAPLLWGFGMASGKFLPDISARSGQESPADEQPRGHNRLSLRFGSGNTRRAARAWSSSLALDVGKEHNFRSAFAADIAAHNVELRRRLRAAHDDLRASREEVLASRELLLEARGETGAPATGKFAALPPIGSAKGASSSKCALRHESTVLASPEKPSDSTIRLRYLSASPLHMPRLDIDADLKEIEDALEGTMEVEPEVASIASLGRAAVETNLWVHITAHTCSGGTALVLEDETCSLGSKVQSLSPSGLEKLFRSGGCPRNGFVFIAACESVRLAYALRASGVQHIVFCPTAAHDRRARCFSRSLYGALAKHFSLEHAFSIARCTAELGGDEGQYGMLSDGALRLEQGPWRSVPLELSPRPNNHRHRKRRVEDFVGRLDVIGAVLSYLGLHCRRVVLLQAAASLGLSATLIEISHRVTMPGRKLAAHGRCSFFPSDAPGGLLIVDDLAALSEQEAEEVRRHLDVEGAQLLAGCLSADRTSLCVSDDKPMCVQLPPLQAREAAELFLLRCQRGLLVEDLFPPDTAASRNPKECIPRSEALALLTKPIQAFGGIPGKIRCAVDKWARKGSPSLQGDPGSLALTVSADTNAQRTKRKVRWV